MIILKRLCVTGGMPCFLQKLVVASFHVKRAGEFSLFLCYHL